MIRIMARDGRRWGFGIRMADFGCTSCDGGMGIVTLRAGIPGMCICQVRHFVTRNVALTMAFQAQVSCGVEILVFIDGWDRQPGILRLDLAFFHPMANVAGYVIPISLCNRWGRRFHLKFTG